MHDPAADFPAAGPARTVTDGAAASPDASGVRDAAAMRDAMIDSQLRTSDVTQPALIAAIAGVPREAHVPAGRRAMAYADRAVPLHGDRSLNPPLATARLILEAGIRAGDRVLLIGGATGYAAAVLARLGAKVTMVESDSALAADARAALVDYALVTVVEGPLADGAADGAPYDTLIVDGAVETLPFSLTRQLAPGARIATGLVDRGVTRLARAIVVGGGGESSAVHPVAFADTECVVLPGFSAPPRFSF